MDRTRSGAPRIIRRILLGVLVMGLVGLGVLWFLSLTPGAYSLTPIGGHGQHGGRQTDITELVDDPERAADVVLRLEARTGYTLNGSSPGPEIRARQGDMVQVDFHNVDIAEGATLHWHGVDVPASMDGVAGVTQDAVKPGETFRYRFTAVDSGTYWYHSHQVSHRQVIAGLFGALIIEPPVPSPEHEITMPLHTYPGASRTIAGQGREMRVAAEPGSHWRVRVINTDNSTAFVWAQDARLLALDGGEIHEPGPVEGRKIRMGAGGRADLGVTVPVTGAVRVQAPGVSLILGDGSPPELPAPAQELDLLSYGTPAEVGFDPEDRDRVFDYTIGRRPGFLNGRPGYWWTVNGRMGHNAPMYMVREGQTIEMRISNRSAEVHPMHLHGHHLLVLSRDGVAASGSPWWTDSLDVLPGESYEVIFKADNPGIWMYHCHNLPHAVDGLMTHLSYEGVSTNFRLGRDSGNEPE